MAKIKTLQKQKASTEHQLELNPNASISEHDPLKYLLDEDNIARTILECLKNNDPQGVIEVIEIYLNALNKAKQLKSAQLARSTYYNLLKHKNPTIKTLAKIVSLTTEDYFDNKSRTKN